VPSPLGGATDWADWVLALKTLAPKGRGPVESELGRMVSSGRRTKPEAGDLPWFFPWWTWLLVCLARAPGYERALGLAGGRRAVLRCSVAVVGCRLRWRPARPKRVPAGRATTAGLAWPLTLRPVRRPAGCNFEGDALANARVVLRPLFAAGWPREPD